MATETRKVKPKPAQQPLPFEAEPTWEIARLFPPQGQWTEAEYFALPTNHFIEFSAGRLEFLPMPTIFHQLILKFLGWELDRFVTARNLGTVVPAPYKVQVGRGKYREPDVLFIETAHQSWIGEHHCRKADLVMEVVSRENRPHDIATKRGEYARAGIPEYWIVDPEEETITVLALEAGRKTYVEHGVFTKGTGAVSRLLPGFTVGVTTAVTRKPEV